MGDLNGFRRGSDWGLEDFMMNQDLKYSDLTGKIIGSAMKVHRELGPGFPEIVYKKSLIIEIQKLDLPVAAEQEKEIYYQGISVGKRRLDLIIDNKILIELKAVTEIDKACYNQILNYLKVFKIEIGLILNFGAASLQFKRFINSN